MRDFQMFTPEGNAAVGKIVDQALQFVEVNEGSIETVWNWVLNELEALSRVESFKEADDTAVREAVYDAII